MRQKGQTTSLAQRLNNALAEIHSQKIYHQQQTEGLMRELQKAREEIDKQKIKIKQLKKQIRQQGAEGNRQSIDSEGEIEQCISKIRHYMTRIQESSHQLTQVASECSIIDAEIEQAASQIQKNMIKSSNGLLKYIQQLMRRWISKQKLKLQNERLEKQNKRLFDFTTKLQQNFKESDRIIKQLTNQAKQPIYLQYPSKDLQIKIQNLQQENRILKSTSTLSKKQMRQIQSPFSHIYKKQITADLQEKIRKLSQKVRNLQQENTTINTIHQRTMNKLQKLQERDRAHENQEKNGIGEILQEERRLWLEKSQKMYEEIKKLNKGLLQAEENQHIIKQKLQFYTNQSSQWQQARQEKQSQIRLLKSRIQEHLSKISQMEINIKNNQNEISLLSERLEVSEEQKQKIVSVYQLQVQELNDQLFNKQDDMAELQTALNRQRHRHDQLKKQYNQVNKNYVIMEEMTNKLKKQSSKEELESKQLQIKQLQLQLQRQGQENIKLRLNLQNQMAIINEQTQKQKIQKDQLVQVISELKDQCFTTEKQLSNKQESLEAWKKEIQQLKKQLQKINKVRQEYTVLDLITITKDTFNKLTEQIKSLKLSHQELISQAQIRQANSSQQLEQLIHQNWLLKKEIESQSQNTQTQFQICKMRIIEQNICEKEDLTKTQNIYQLINAMEDSYKRIVNFKPVFDSKLKKDLEQKQTELISLQRRLRTLQQQNEIYKSQLQATLSQNNAFKNQIEKHNIQLERYQQVIKLITEKHETIQHLLQQKSNQLAVKTFKINEYQAIIEKLQNSQVSFQILSTQFLKQKEQQSSRVSHEQAMDADYEIIKLTIQNQQKCNLIDQLQHKIHQQTSQSKNQQLFIKNLAEQNLILNQNQKELKLQIQKMILQKEEILRSQLANSSTNQRIISEEEQAIAHFEKLCSHCKQIKQENYTLNYPRDISTLTQNKEQINLSQSEINKIKQDNQKLTQTIIQMTEQMEKSQVKFNQILEQQKNNQLSQSSYFQFKEERLREREVHLKEKQTSIKQKSKDIQKKQQELRTWNQKIKTKVREIQGKETQINIKIDELQQQSIQIHQKYILISQKQTELKQQKTKIEKQQQFITQKQSQVVLFQNQHCKIINQMQNIKTQSERLAQQLIQEKKQKNILSEKNNQNQKVFHQLQNQENLLDQLKVQLHNTCSQYQKLKFNYAQIQGAYYECIKNKSLSQQQNKELQLSIEQLHYQIQQSRQLREQLAKENEALKQSNKMLMDQIQKLEDITTIAEVMKQKVSLLENCQHQLQEMEKSHSQLEENIFHMAIHLQECQVKNKILQAELEAKDYQIETLQSKNIESKNQIQKLGNLQGQNFTLSQKIAALQQQLKQLSEDINNKQALLEQMEASRMKEQIQRLTVQQQLRLKQLDYQNLIKQYESCKLQMEQIRQKKTLVQDQVINCQISLTEQENGLKTKLTSMEIEIQQSRKVNSQIVEKLKQEIQTLKSNTKQQKQSSILDRQPVTKSILQQTDKQQQNLPLQVPKSRFKTGKLNDQDKKLKDKYQQELEMVQKYQTLLQEENKYLKTEMIKYEKVSAKLHQCQKISNNLSNQIQGMKSELKSKTFSLQTLQKQFKSKSQDYSKLQRFSESIKDELNLQKKRVKNFEQLYYNLQLKRNSFVLKKKIQNQ